MNKFKDLLKGNVKGDWTLIVLPVQQNKHYYNKGVDMNIKTIFAIMVTSMSIQDVNVFSGNSVGGGLWSRLTFEHVHIEPYKEGISLYFGDVELRRWKVKDKHIECFFEEKSIEIDIMNGILLRGYLENEELKNAPWL